MPNRKQLDISDPKRNRILAKMQLDDYKALMGAGAEVIVLKLRRRLHRQNQPIDAVYFPLTSMVSLLVGTNNEAIEMATVGNEGVVAGEIAEAPGAMSFNVVQIAGSALRIDADAFRRLLHTRPLIKAVVQRHLYTVTRQILYGAACNRMHSMEQRCARWLLMTHDRAGQDTFVLTQEFLSNMLGVRRATVNQATRALKNAGLIHYARGQLTVINRRGLESASCACYGAIVKIYDSIMADGRPR